MRDNDYLRDLAYHRGEVILRNKPKLFALESTNFCNISCIMCPRGEPDLMTRSLGHMDNELMRRVLDQFDYFNQPTWLHWFGEPLMNPHLFEQIALAKEKVPRLGISTNATLMRPEQQRRLLDSGLDQLLIAVDGDTKDVYERVRKSARFSFEQVVENVEQFLAMRAAAPGTNPMHVTLSIIVMEETSPDLDSFRDHWLSRGADAVLFKPFANWGGQYAEVFSNLEISDRRHRLRELRPNPCKFMWESVVVGWDGRIVPCCFDYDATMTMGNLRTQSLQEIWNGPAYVALRKAEIAGANSCSLCANCSQAPGHARNPSFGLETTAA